MSSSAPAPLAPRSDQELFDTALFGIRKQGCFSRCGNKCLYRGPNGAKCAVGHLIPDNVIEYVGGFESGAMSDVVQNVRLDGPGERLIEALHLCGINKDQYELLEALQEAHDGSSVSMSNQFRVFEHEMEQVANSFGLTYTPPSP